MSDVRDDPAAGRYELAIDGALAIAAYRREGDVVVFTHTEVPPPLRDRGIATELVQGALADVRRRGLRIRPDCPFVADYLDRHPEERDLLA